MMIYSLFKNKGFTLAEMMVVMLILTILLAAFAPLMTKRKTVDTSSPWHWAVNNSDIYYGLADSQTAIIGQNSKSSSDPESRLTLSTSSASQSYINLKQGSTLYGNLVMPVSSSIYLGGPYTSASTMTGSYNTGFGISALSKNTSGGYNTGIGYSTLYTNTTGKYNTALGYGTLYTNTTGHYNTGVGYDSLYKNTTGAANTALGYGTLYTNTTGQYNTGVGYDSLYKNTTGAANTALGYGTLYTNTTGQYNTGVGQDSLYKNTTGAYNTAVGEVSLYSNTTGAYNTALGNWSLYKNTTGAYNTAVGYGSCQYVTTGSHKTCIGFASGPASGTTYTTDTSERVLYLGDSSTTVYIPGRLVIDGLLYVKNTLYAESDGFMALYLDDESHKLRWGDAAVKQHTGYDTVGMMEKLNVYSDRRLKDIKGENKSGLEKIRALKVYNFTFKKDDAKTPHVGVTAQELQEIFPDAVSADSEGYLTIRLEDMFYAMINAIKQLDNIVQGLINELKVIETKLDNVIKKQLELEKRLDKIEKRSV